MTANSQTLELYTYLAKILSEYVQAGVAVGRAIFLSVFLSKIFSSYNHRAVAPVYNPCFPVVPQTWHTPCQLELQTQNRQQKQNTNKNENEIV